MVQGWDTVGESALVNGYQIRVRRKDLEAEDGCQDPNFFDDDYSIAASTGMPAAATRPLAATRPCDTNTTMPHDARLLLWRRRHGRVGGLLGVDRGAA